MAAIEDSLDAIRRVVTKLGAAEAARLSGVPYTTLIESSKKNFVARSTETLLRLAEFAEEYEREHGREPEAGAHEAAA